MADRISEKELVLPALLCMVQSPRKTLSTSQLLKELTEMLRPTGQDAEILNNRGDTKFSQKVRNALGSHKTIERLGFTVYERRGTQGYWTATRRGETFLEENLPLLTYALGNDFSYEDVKDVLNEQVEYEKSKKPRPHPVLFDEDITIKEGMKATVERSVYARSAKLRDAAIDYYTKNGRILCGACRFDFEQRYGRLGRGFIEVHHHRPVFAYEGQDLNKAIREALKNVSPLCSNCHRMVHRRRDKVLSVDELKALIVP